MTKTVAAPFTGATFRTGAVFRRRKACGYGFVLLVLLLAGCTGRYPVEGVVTLDGKPLEGIGSVMFMPEEEGKRPAQGAILASKFVLSTSDKGGVMPGKYKVVISSQKGGKETLPRTYSSSRTTILTFEVPKGGNKDVHFDLNSKGTAPENLSPSG